MQAVVVVHYRFILIGFVLFSVSKETGALASWGGAEFGQLGFEAGSMVDGVQPRIVKGSRDLHFSRVAAGAAHTLALTGASFPLLVSYLCRIFKRFTEPVCIQGAGTYTHSDKAVMVLWGMEIWIAATHP